MDPSKPVESGPLPQEQQSSDHQPQKRKKKKNKPRPRTRQKLREQLQKQQEQQQQHQQLDSSTVAVALAADKTEDEEIATVVRRQYRAELRAQGLPIPRESDESDDEEDSILTPAEAFRRKYFLDLLPEIKQGFRRIHQQQSEIREKAEVLKREHRERLDRLEEEYLRQFARLEEEHQKQLAELEEQKVMIKKEEDEIQKLWDEVVAEYISLS
ncbi:hypothetical protein SI65_05106 [Aspergillus cristatus]|uniref:Uncharacterized protein n=1 Tax=Aspergillus cristatus TaxID=573508 RepID=A0A1E3BGR2_ASPCR|nr:hypothetical protein SI65_05106 [Aspergillus cristatus]